MRRRDFLGALGGAAVSWPLTANAQQQDKLPTIGLIVAGTPASHGPWLAAFVQRLRELGWLADRNVAIEIRWSEVRSERFAEIASEFVRLKVDVIVTAGGAVFAAKQATSVIPIVFAAMGDPLGTGLVASLARPGGNVTGLSLQQSGVGTKRLELLREVIPSLHRLAVMANAEAKSAMIEMGEIQATARVLGLDATTFELRRAEDIAPAFEAIRGHADALYVCGDSLTVTNRVRISTLALAARLPTVTDFREYAEAGGLMCYGANISDLYRRAADYVDKILKGAKPADLPVEQASKFDLIINLTTAKAIGLTVPPALLARVDEVIE